LPARAENFQRPEWDSREAAVGKAVEELGMAGENQIRLAFRLDAMIRTKSEQ
jgi:hypothetical protein